MARSAVQGLFGPGPDSLRYRVYCLAFTAASLVHLTLPDALQWSWLLPNLVYLVGLALIAGRGAIAGWILAAVGLAVPLIFLADQLTQSAFLLMCALCVVGFWIGPDASRKSRLDHALPTTVGYLTAATYFIALFHKLNRDFFDPAVSCANGGVEVLFDNWNLGLLESSTSHPAWAFVFIATEASMVVLLLRNVRLGILLGILMHIPLTIVFAPSFAFTMISGWVCLLDERQLRWLGARFASHWKWIVPGGLALGGLSFVLYLQRHWVVYPYWSFKEALLWVGFVWMLFAFRGFPARVVSKVRPGVRTWVAISIWLLHGLLPYTGLKFHHSGAMLSNLRVDAGCWNSLVVPELLRFHDPYFRIRSISLPETEAQQAIDLIWTTGTLMRAREVWCERGGVTFRLEGGSEDQDLCALPADWTIGVASHQSNLNRECPQSCIH